MHRSSTPTCRVVSAAWLLTAAWVSTRPAAGAEAVHCFHEPQVRYILADIQLGGLVDYYRNWAEKVHDPDSARVVKEWRAGTRVVNLDRFERKDVEGKFGKGKRIVFRGTNWTITGNEVVLTTDLAVEQAAVRYILADLTLGFRFGPYREAAKADPNAAAALSRWDDGVRAVNAELFTAEGEGEGEGAARRVVYGAGGTNFGDGTAGPPARRIDGAVVRLNSDVPYDEAVVRYILADLHLGGAPAFYQEVVDTSHDPHSAEAMARWESGYKILNLEAFERKEVEGKTLITYKTTERRIDGSDVKLSSDPR